MGSVSLVGAGCGPDLITIKGLNAIKSADVIVYDDLIDDNLLNYAKSDAELIYVGKRFGNHSEKQENINRILINNALDKKYVIRLKGGDSFVFGRGGEEVIALESMNIPYDIIPGISSSIAVPENLGIPVTHRSVAQSFTVVTGHTAAQTEENYRALAGLKGTLVFLMPLHNMNHICKSLIKNGMDKNTSAAIISRGFNKNQQRINGTLNDIAAKAEFAEAPAILVVGSVAQFDFRKTKKLLLEDVSITVTGTKDFSYYLSEKIKEQGAYVSTVPNIDIVTNYSSMPIEFNSYTYLVFTSSVGVKVFFSYLKNNGIDFRKISHLKFACVGSGTALKLSEYGFNADFIPSEYTAKTLGKELSAKLNKNDYVLILRAKDGSDELTAELYKADIKYKDVKIYYTKANDKRIDCDTDYITFASSGSVSAFFENGGKLNKSKPVCIGEITANELVNYSNITPLISKKHTADGIISLILEDKYETLQKIETE